MEKRRIISIISFIVFLVVVSFVLYFSTDSVQIEERHYKCEDDSDCVLAIEPNSCCLCPLPVTKFKIDNSDEFLLYEEGKDYSDFFDNESCELTNYGEYCDCLIPNGVECIDYVCQVV